MCSIAGKIVLGSLILSAVGGCLTLIFYGVGCAVSPIFPDYLNTMDRIAIGAMFTAGLVGLVAFAAMLGDMVCSSLHKKDNKVIGGLDF